MKTERSTKRPFPKDKGSTFGEAVRNMGGWGPYYRWLHMQKQPLVVKKLPGRNALVTIKKGDAGKVLKYKKAQRFFEDGWELE